MGNRLFAIAACAFCAAAIAGPFDQFKGKMKPGMYETTMDMEMPGMPAGMGKHTMKMQNCVTPEDIEKGQVVCKQPEMTADTKITFNDGGYKMDMKMAVNRNGQPMNMTQHMEGRYVGPCQK